ncbi:MAG: hypothetical protein AAF242_17205, partial [Bacteroidota bacterium]
MKKILPVLFILISSLAYSQILTFEFNGIAGNETSVPSNSNDANLMSSSISRGSDINASGNANRFNSTQWTTGSSIDLNEYLSFTISPNAGYEFNVSSIDINHQRSGTGPISFAIRSSIDGFTSNLGTFSITGDATTIQQSTINLTITNQSSAVEIRIYGFDSEGSSGSWGPGEGSGDDIVVNGSANCIAPTMAAMSFSATNIGGTTMDLSFTRGNGDGGVLILAKEGAAVDAEPSEGVSYIANAAFGSGDEIGTGNFVVFNGIANGTNTATGNISISGLTQLTNYHYAIYEYNATVPCYNFNELVGNATTICDTPTDVLMLTALGKNGAADIQWTDP